jgi:GH35 family endo-1,4-beta-xylanase
MLIGGCVNEGNKNYWLNAAGKAQLLKDCNTVTVQCYPGWGRWDETKHHVYHVDAFTSQVQDMKKEHMNVTAHMLLGWDQYFPTWFKENDFPADTLEAIMQSWLKGIIQYKGNDTLVDVWNVVNEAISWNGTGKYWPENNTDHLNACEMQRMGYEDDASGLTGVKKPNIQHPVYIRKSFEYARTLTKKKLELRDSGFEFPTDSKYNAFYELAVHLKKMNAPVDVIGFQTHLDLEKVYDWVGYSNNIKRYVDLGYEVNIPEVDIGDVAKTWSDYKADLQKAQYYKLVTAAIKGGASELQTWGFIDDGWRPGQHAFPYSNYFEPKPAYYGIKEALIDMSSILYWEMDAPVDGKMPDVMKYNNFGTLHNFSTPVIVTGYQSKALQFDGVDDYISTGKLSDSISRDMTFSCYIKTSTTKPSIVADIASEETSGLKIGITADGKIYLNAAEAGLSTDLVGLTAVNDDAWHFIALQRDSATCRLYIDGNAAVVSSKGDIHKYTKLVLGAKSDGTSAFYGTIDEVKLYDTAIEEGSFTRSMSPWAPIRLAISKNKMSMRLDWLDQSANEKGFIVERKTTDTDWQEIGRVNTNIPTYTDIVPLYNTEYSYRVSSYSLAKSAPSNSVTVTSPLDPNTGLSDKESNHIYSIYPNPVQDKFTLISPLNTTMKLFDLQGKLMLEKRNCNNIESFDLSTFSKGIYFVQTCDNNTSNVIKLIKY